MFNFLQKYSLLFIKKYMYQKIKPTCTKEMWAPNEYQEEMLINMLSHSAVPFFTA